MSVQRLAAYLNEKTVQGTQLETRPYTVLDLSWYTKLFTGDRTDISFFKRRA